MEIDSDRYIDREKGIDLEEFNLCNTCEKIGHCRILKVIAGAAEAVDLSVIIEKCRFYKNMFTKENKEVDKDE